MSLGLDLGDAQALTELGLDWLASGLFSPEKKYQSLALGFSNLQCISSGIIDTLFNQIDKQAASLRFLRLNFSNCMVSSEILEKILSHISNLKLERLEMFIGGNRNVDDSFFRRFFRVAILGGVKGVVLDVGYTSCSKKAVKSALKQAAENLVFLGLYLNG